MNKLLSVLQTRKATASICLCVIFSLELFNRIMLHNANMIPDDFFIYFAILSCLDNVRKDIERNTSK